MSKSRTPQHFPRMKHRAAKRRGPRITIWDENMRPTASTHTRFRPGIRKIRPGALRITTESATRELTPASNPFWIAPVGTPFPKPGTDPEVEGWKILGHGGPVALHPLRDLVGDALDDADDARAEK